MASTSSSSRTYKDLTEILPNFLYLSNHSTAQNLPSLQSAEITHVINLVGKPSFPSEFGYRTIHFPDTTDTDVRPIIQAIVEYIISVTGTSVTSASEPKVPVPGSRFRFLIHCSGGISRSPAVVIGFLIAARGMTLKEAYILVKTARRGVKVNLGFLEALRELEITERGSESVSKEDLSRIGTLFKAWVK